MEQCKIRTRNDEDGITVLIGKNNAQESTLYIQTHQIKSAAVTYSYEESQIDFLSECPTIESFSLEGPNVKNLSGLYHVKGLKSLSINDTAPSLAIDFSQLATLEEIYGTLPPKAVAIGSLINLKKLRRLGLFSMRSLMDISVIQHLSENLKDLEIESAKNKTLS